MNSSVVVHDGVYHLFSIDNKQAKLFMNSSNVKSSIGYKETADVINDILDIHIEPSRDKVMMSKGDQALIFKLHNRIDKESKGKLTKEFIKNNYSFKILRRIE
jgi:hypothetical protein